MDKVVGKMQVSSTNSLSAVEWKSMETAMVPDERTTHRNLASWMKGQAKVMGVQEVAEEDEEDEEDGEAGEDGEDDDDDEEDEDPKFNPPTRSLKQLSIEEEKKDEKKEEKNWSAVNIAALESKLSFRGCLSQHTFTNWLWHFVIRQKLDESKGKLPERESAEVEGADDVDEIFREFMPVIKKKEEKKDKKEDKKDKKDKKEDKADKKDKKHKKHKKDTKETSERRAITT